MSTTSTRTPSKLSSSRTVDPRSNTASASSSTTDILYSGHIDRLVEYNDDLYIQDQKTTASTVGPYWFNKFAPDTQMTGYTYAGNVVFQMPVKGVIIDAAQVAITFSVSNGASRSAPKRSSRNGAPTPSTTSP